MKYQIKNAVDTNELSEIVEQAMNELGFKIEEHETWEDAIERATDRPVIEILKSAVKRWWELED